MRSRAVIALVGLGVGVVAALAGAAALVGSAALVPVPAVFLAIGAVVFLFVALAGIGWLTRARGDGRRRRLVLSIVMPGLMAYVLLVVVPPSVVPDAWIGLPATTAATREPRGGRLVSLSTGSRLEVWRFPAAEPSRMRGTIVVVHGGPGVPDTAGYARAFGPLTTAGYQVVLYAQLGTDGSSRLANPGEYGRDRDVADLEALRQRLGLERMTLIGHSYGGAVAAAYLAAHPDRVSRLVLISPGALDPDDHSGELATSHLGVGARLGLYARVLLTPRSTTAYLVLQVSPRAARAYLPDHDADRLNDAVLAASAPGLHCPGKPAPIGRGSGFYAMQAPQSATAHPPRDPRPDLRGLPTPTLILKGALRLPLLAFGDRVRPVASELAPRLLSRLRPRCPRGPAGGGRSRDPRVPGRRTSSDPVVRLRPTTPRLPRPSLSRTRDATG